MDDTCMIVLYHSLGLYHKTHKTYFQVNMAILYCVQKQTKKIMKFIFLSQSMVGTNYEIFKIPMLESDNVSKIYTV